MRAFLWRLLHPRRAWGPRCGAEPPWRLADAGPCIVYRGHADWHADGTGYIWTTTETLGCIYCQGTITWPPDQLWPSVCLLCGRGPGPYTVRSGPRWAWRGPTINLAEEYANLPDRDTSGDVYEATFTEDDTP